MITQDDIFPFNGKKIRHTPCHVIRMLYAEGVFKGQLVRGGRVYDLDDYAKYIGSNWVQIVQEDEDRYRDHSE